MVSLLYSFKSLKKNPILTILAILCIIFSTLILMMTNNLSDVSNTFYNKVLSDKYGDYNFVLTADYETDSSFAVKSDILQLEEYYDDFISAFGSIATVNNNIYKTDVDLLVCDTNTLSLLTKQTYNNLGYGDVIISKSFAEKLKVKVNDKITINHFGYTETLYISQIVDNDSIFSNSNELPKIVINDRTMKDLVPSFIKTEYMFNIAFFHSDNMLLIEELKNVFPNFTVIDVDQNSYNTISLKKIDSTTILMGVPSLILCFLITYTIFSYISKYNEKEIIKLNKLGFKNNFQIYLIQSSILSIACLVITHFTCIILLKFINAFYNINYMFEVKDILFFISYITILPLFLNIIINIKKKSLSLIKLLIISLTLIILISLNISIIVKVYLVLSLIFVLPELFKLIVLYLPKKIPIILMKIEKCSLLPILTISLIVVCTVGNYFEIYNSSQVVLSHENDVTITGFDQNLEYKELFKNFDCNYIYEKSDIEIDDVEVLKLYGIDSKEELNKIFNFNVNSLNSNEVVVSNYYKINNNLNINDEIDVVINNVTHSLIISDFIETDAYFGRVIFVNTETLLTNYNVKNYNKIIFKNINLEQVNLLLEENNVSARVFFGEDVVSEMINKNSFFIILVYLGIVLIVCIEISFVIILRYNSIAKELRTFKIIGFSNNKILINDLIVFLIKLFISLFSFILIYLLYCNIINQLLEIKDVYSAYQMTIYLSPFLIIFLITAVLTATITITLNVNKNKQ